MNAMLVQSLPREINTIIINNIPLCSSFKTIEEVSGVMQSLSCVNKSWNLYINDSENALSVIKKLSKKFDLSNMEVTEKLSIVGAKHRYSTQLAALYDWDRTSRFKLHKNLNRLLTCGLDLNFTYGLDLNFTCNQKHPTMLIKAICCKKYGHSDVGKWLIEHGADINLITEYEENAIMLAIDYFNEDFIPLFLDHPKLNVHHQDDEGDTVLHHCFGRAIGVHYLGKIDFKKCEKMCSIIEKLLQKGADPRLCNKQKKTPIDLAKETGYEPFLKILDPQYNS